MHVFLCVVSVCFFFFSFSCTACFFSGSTDAGLRAYPTRSLSWDLDSNLGLTTTRACYELFKFLQLPRVSRPWQLHFQFCGDGRRVISAVRRLKQQQLLLRASKAVHTVYLARAWALLQVTSSAFPLTSMQPIAKTWPRFLVGATAR